MSRSGSLIAAILLLTAAGHSVASGDRPLARDSVYQLHAEFRDQTGKAVVWRDLRGQPRIVTMLYASCRYVCPMIVDSLRSVERGLSAVERDRIGFVLVTMDPEHDTPAALSRLMKERRLTAPAWKALQPRPEDVRPLAGLLGIRFRPLEDGEFNHTTVLVLLDAEGRILARTERIGGANDAEFMASVRAAVRAH